MKPSDAGHWMGVRKPVRTLDAVCPSFHCRAGARPAAVDHALMFLAWQGHCGDRRMMLSDGWVTRSCWTSTAAGCMALLVV
jgi:hypothetical protein